MLVLELLKCAGASVPTRNNERVVSALTGAQEQELRWILDGGLGPTLHFAVRDQLDRIPAAWRDILVSSDITARVRHACAVDTAVEVIDVCQRLGTSATLLKGISTGDQYYPSAHLRPMGDIDVLVSREASEAVESALLGLGYRSDIHHPRNDDMHHLPPLLHPERGIWLELHTGLFPAHDELRQGNLFDVESVASQLRTSCFHQRVVRRLSDELQLAYIASSWMRDLTLSGVSPSFLASLLDLIYLLKKVGTTLDWNRVLQLIDNDNAMASLFVTLTYVRRHGLYPVPNDALSSLRARQRLISRLELLVIHLALDRHLLGGRSWNHPLPLPVPGRYNLRNQLRKRLSTGAHVEHHDSASR